MSILKIHAREIFDSRGNPTVEVDLYTEKGRHTHVASWFPLPQFVENVVWAARQSLICSGPSVSAFRPLGLQVTADWPWYLRQDVGH